MTALPPGKNYRGERSPCLVMYRPGIGIASVAVKDFEQVAGLVAVWSTLLPSHANVEWWVEPDALPVWAGGSVMDVEQQQAIKEKAERGAAR